MMVQMGMAKDYHKYSGGYYQYEQDLAKQEGRGIWKGYEAGSIRACHVSDGCQKMPGWQSCIANGPELSVCAVPQKPIAASVDRFLLRS
jgi:hypothetical protein